MRMGYTFSKHMYICKYARETRYLDKTEFKSMTDLLLAKRDMLKYVYYVKTMR